MTYDNANDHAAFRDSIAAALAGGLTAAEQVAFDAHRAVCPDCAGEFERAKESEARMTELFAAARPAVGFEDRVIQHLRESAPSSRRFHFARPRWIHPALGKAVAGVAAAIVLGGVGYAVSGLLEETAAVQTASNLRDIGRAEVLYSNDNHGVDPRDGAIRSGEATRRPVSIEQKKSGAGTLTLGNRFNFTPGYKADVAALGDAAYKDNGRAVANRGEINGTTLNYSDADHDSHSARGMGNDDGIRNGPVSGAADAKGKASADDFFAQLQPPTPAITPAAAPSPDAPPPPAAAGANWFKPTQLGISQDGTNSSGGKPLHGEEHVARQLEDVQQQKAPAPAPADAAGAIPTLKPALAPEAAEPNAPAQTPPPAGPSTPGFGSESTQNDYTLGRRVLAGTVVQKEKESAIAQQRVQQSTEQLSTEREKTITDLQQQAERLSAAGRGDEARRVVAQIQAMDPQHQVAAAGQPANEPSANAQPTTQAAQRKVIRNGDLTFEVDRFDSAFAQVSKLTTEAGGYVGTTSSEKLPNGKVQGKVTVRVPPDRLDTLVLQLRGIGDLKSQSLEAQDVSKKYTDLESQLRAARAMEERLLGIIKEGKGQIKDLLAAEKELGTWRTKVEELTGEMKYYDNLVSMATLNLTLTERDIETPATAYQSETVDAGVESEDVETARAAALKAIEEAKGRVVQSDLKRYDAGQFGATIVAEVPPDGAGPLLDRLKQIGKVARLDVQRKQTASEKKPFAVSRAPVRIEKRDTTFNLSIYNLANVASRQTATLNLAADDVEKAYQAILDRVAKAGGRIVSSNLNRQKPEQTTATIAFEIPTPQAEAVTTDLRAAGEAMKLTVTENPDVQNVTTAKRGFNVSLVATAAVAPRETTTIQLAAADVAQAREKILSVATAQGGQAVQVRASQLNENDRQNISATLELDVKRSALPAVEKAIADAGQIVRRNVSRSSDAENTLDTKVRLSIALAPADRLPPRETTTLAVELSDVEAAMASLQSAAIEAGGRVVVSNLQKDRDGRGIARVTVDVPLDKSATIVRTTRELGVVRAIDASKDLQVPPGGLARARVDVTFANADTLVAPERGVFASIRRGLATSVEGLMLSLQFIIVGLCFILPWALVLYAVWRYIKRRRRTEATATPTPIPA